MEWIAETLKNSWNCNRVLIEEDDSNFRCKSAFNWRQLLPDFFAPFLDDDYRRENRKTIEYFYRIFGESRIKQISRENDLSLEYKRIHGLALTRGEVEVLFVNMGVVTVDTMQAIFEQLKNDPQSYLHLSQNAARELQQRFQDREFTDLTKEDFDRLYAVASPFEKIDTYFLNNPPTINKPYSERWRNLNGMKKMVYILEDVRRRVNPDLNKAQLECDFRKIKKLVSYCVRDGVVFPEPKGYRYVYEKIEGGGAYKVFLKALTKTDSFRSQICYLPTQAWGSAVKAPWESMMEDARPEIGAFGIMTTYQDTKERLYNPRYGFVSNEEEKVDSLGYSLGGTAAQRDYCLFYGKLQNLIAVNNPAVDELTANEFARRINRGPLPAALPKITYIWDTEDTIPYGGDEFLGRNCRADRLGVEVHLIKPIVSDDEICPIMPKRQRAPEGWLETLQKIKQSFSGIHGRETTISDYREHVLNNRNPSMQIYLDDEILTNQPYGWEEKRKTISRFLFGDALDGEFLNFYRRHAPN
ncbi:MAG: hypothetical protein Tsb0015_11830 [Simkaniaceae bacterium]